MKPLTLVLLLSAFSSLTLTEVVKTLDQWKSTCRAFFIQNPKKLNERIVPTIFPGPQYKMICQRWKGKYRFATLYDTKRRIPVYSAYTFLKKGKSKRNDVWKIEPQLENITKSHEMMNSPREAGTIKHQAVNSDYAHSGYSRGHVFPCSFAANPDQADSTFTLTNVAPQRESSNQEWAKQVEDPMRRGIIRECRLDQNHHVYVVSGVVPGSEWLSITRKDINFLRGINIPSHFWSAFRCTSRNNIIISRAYIAEQERFHFQQLTIGKLNKRLTDLYGQDFRVFPGLLSENLKSPV